MSTVLIINSGFVVTGKLTAFIITVSGTYLRCKIQVKPRQICNRGKQSPALKSVSQDNHLRLICAANRAITARVSWRPKDMP